MTQPFLDRPEVLRLLFHPRRQYGPAVHGPGVVPIHLEVEPGLALGGRLYPANPESPALLYFHGNGEIAADYDDVAALYTRQGITLPESQRRRKPKNLTIAIPTDLVTQGGYCVRDTHTRVYIREAPLRGKATVLGLGRPVMGE